MKKVWTSIIITTAVWLIFQFSPFFTSSFGVITSLMGITTIFMIWMVITILKAPYDGEKTFEEAFYEDRDYKRNNP